MSTNVPKRTRQQRVASVELPPGVWGTLAAQLQRGAVLLRLALCALVAIFLWAFAQAWDPPIAYYEGDIPHRDVVALIDFEEVDAAATEQKRQQARSLAKAVYDQNPTPLVQLRAQLRSEISKLLAAENYAAVDPAVWQSFQPPLAAGTPDPTAEEREQQFLRFREAFAEENALELYDQKVAEVLTPLEQWGLLESLPEEHKDLNFEKIFVRAKDRTGESFGPEAEVAVAEVLIDNAAAKLQTSLNEKLASLELAQRTYAWLRPRLKTTLTLNLAATRLAQEEAAKTAPIVTKPYRAGEDVIAKAGVPIGSQELKLLELEYFTLLSERDLGSRMRRSAAIFGMFLALYTLAGYYLVMREPTAVAELSQFMLLLGMVLVTIVLSMVVSQYQWGTEIIPLLLMSMTLAIAYQQEMALLISALVTLVLVVLIGHDLSQALVLMATASGAVLVLRRVRTRGKLLSVGFVAACVALLTTVGVGTLFHQPLSLALGNGAILALWAIISGSLMSVLLPYIEMMFQVQTDLSLIELGDPANALLQELIRRAPGTYNHSITVASLAEAAAEAIGARGLLVRVGAYFHDIGKMLKPGYFIENQRDGDNRHDTLVPAMSTLVIIAHVKDGADLARQRKLPEPIIDFIQQHHGTTLVEYFYRQASQQNKENDGGEVDESSFRYPGPKPQTKEAGVLMLADAVESATRALKEPTPARIENLVEDISQKRLLDGQFDECGLTLEEVRKIGESLVKSLTAVYHGRVKYPGQETA